MSIVAYTFFFGRYESSPAITYRRRRPSMKSTQQQSELEKEKKKVFTFFLASAALGMRTDTGCYLSTRFWRSPKLWRAGLGNKRPTTAAVKPKTAPTNS